MRSRGALIVLEGVDRTGKTTQASMLVEALKAQGHSIKGQRFPDRTTATGKVINAYLASEGVQMDDHVIHLLFSANRWEAQAEMKRMLEEGTTLVVDRYSYSGVAFTAAKGLDFDWCCGPEKGLPEPDAIMFLDLSIDEAKKRGDFGAERYEREEFQLKVRDMYQRLKGPSWITIDAARTPEEVHAELKGLTLNVIQSVSGKPIKSLWV